MKTTFHNLSITIEAPSPEEALDVLDNLLGNKESVLAYCTDTFTTDEDDETEHDVVELLS